MTLDAFLNAALRAPFLLWIASVLDSTWTTVLRPKYLENTAFLCVSLGYSIVLQLLPLAEVKTQFRYLLAIALICVESAYTEGHRSDELAIYLVSKTVSGTFVVLLIGLKSWNRLLPLVYTVSAALVHNFQTYNAVLPVAVVLLQMIWSLLPPLLRQLCRCRKLSAKFILSTVVQLWYNRSLSVQFLLLWVIRFAYVFFNLPPSELDSVLIIFIYMVSLTLMSPLYLFAFCVSVSYVSYGILSLAKFYIQKGIDVTIDQEFSSGRLQGLMAVLAVLTSDFNYFKLAVEESLALIGSIFLHTFLSFSYSLLEITQPVIESLYIPRVRPVGVYFRVFTFSAFVFVLPLYTSYLLFTTFDLSITWKFLLLDQVIVSLHIFESLFICFLHLYDARNNETWDSLDDLIFYFKATVGVLEFIVACLYFLSAIFTGGNYIFFMVLLVYVFSNILIPLKTGWATYNLRRTMLQRIKRLPTATQDQLRNHNDGCAICFQHLWTARITTCGHYFHSVCLKKWLSIQNVCPVCRHPINPYKPV